jgi:DNA-binding GntR family transcriptional regulator
MIGQQHACDRYMQSFSRRWGIRPNSQEHRALLRAYQRGETMLAVDILTKHIQAAGVLLIVHLRQRE